MAVEPTKALQMHVNTSSFQLTFIYRNEKGKEVACLVLLLQRI